MDINSLTVGEVAKIESLSGQAISALGDEDKPKGKIMAAFAFVIKYRENPKFTWENALELTLTEVNELLGYDAEGNSTTDPKE